MYKTQNLTSFPKIVSEAFTLSNRIRFRDNVFHFQQMIHVCGIFTNKKIFSQRKRKGHACFFLRVHGSSHI